MLEDVTLRWKTLHYVERRHTTLKDVTLRKWKTLRYVEKRYATLEDAALEHIMLRCKTLRYVVRPCASSATL